MIRFKLHIFPTNDTQVIMYTSIKSYQEAIKSYQEAVRSVCPGVVDVKFDRLVKMVI